MNRTARVPPTGEILLALFMILVSVLIFIAGLGLPEPALEPVGPAAFPIWTAIILFVLSAIVLFRAATGRVQPKTSPEHRQRSDLVIYMIALTAIYGAVMNLGWMGFRWATVIYCFVLTFVLFDFDKRKIPAAIILALVLGIGVHYIFTRILYIDLP